jgi:hypothetical protein
MDSKKVQGSCINANVYDAIIKISNTLHTELFEDQSFQRNIKYTQIVPQVSYFCIQYIVESNVCNILYKYYSINIFKLL